MSARPSKPRASSQFKPVRNAARHWEDSAGNRISRRSYENLRSQEAGFKDWAHYQRLRKDPLYLRLAKEAISGQGKDYAELRKMDSKFNKLFVKAEKPLNAKKGKGYTSPKGPSAQLLVYVGLRDPDSYVDVGASNPE